ncbi:MAG: hypothetical protein AB1489_12610 [Acidobacteriota bacterium]
MITPTPATKLLLLLLLLLAPSQMATAQQPLQDAALAPHWAIGNSDVLAREERTGNLAKLTAEGTTARLNMADNQPPNFTISPETRTMRVGERIIFNFAFGDPERDPYFAGVIAVTPSIKLEGTPEKPKQAQRRAAVKINVLTPNDPSVVVWEVTAQTPGVAVFFVSIAELFSTIENGQLKLFSGQITHVVYTLRVIGDKEDSSAPPTFINRLSDLNLRLGERMQMTFAAESPEKRPIVYSFLFLAYASRLVNGRFGANIANLRAIEPGRGIMVAYATDGNKADLQSFLVSVTDPKSPPETALKLRALSANALIGRGRAVTLDLYGNNFTAASQVIMATLAGEERLPTNFISDTLLRVTLPIEFRDMATLRVEDGTVSTASLSFHLFGPIITEIKRLRNEAGKVNELRLLGLGLNAKVQVTANGQLLKVIKERTIHTKLLDRLIVALPSQLRQQERIEIRLQSNFSEGPVLAGTPIILPLK